MTCCIVACLHNSVCCCFALLRFMTTWNLLQHSFSFKVLVQISKKNKSQRKKKSLQRYRTKCIKRRLYGKYYKMFASKNDRSKCSPRQEFDRSNPRSGRTLSIDWPLFWALISTLTNKLITLWCQQLLYISNDVWKTVSELLWRHNQDRKLKNSIDFKNVQSTQINWNWKN